MEAVIVAIIGTIGAIAVAFLESGRRTSKARWEENKADHNFVVDKIDTMGKTLGISIDRVEKGVERTEAKIDQHIADHARGEFQE
jgi:hypothetical protein